MGSKIFLYVAIVALANTPQAEGECCYSALNGVCPDCTLKNPGQYYCGAGPGGCNALGCNCDGGCLTGECRRARSIVEGTPDQSEATETSEKVTGHDVIRWGDLDGNDALDKHEVKIFLARHGVVVEVDAWRALDIDGDGKLASHEIDSGIK